MINNWFNKTQIFSPPFFLFKKIIIVVYLSCHDVSLTHEEAEVHVWKRVMFPDMWHIDSVQDTRIDVHMVWVHTLSQQSERFINEAVYNNDKVRLIISSFYSFTSGNFSGLIAITKTQMVFSFWSIISTSFELRMLLSLRLLSQEAFPQPSTS